MEQGTKPILTPHDNRRHFGLSGIRTCYHWATGTDTFTVHNYCLQHPSVIHWYKHILLKKKRIGYGINRDMLITLSRRSFNQTGKGLERENPYIDFSPTSPYIVWEQFGSSQWPANSISLLCDADTWIWKRWCMQFCVRDQRRTGKNVKYIGRHHGMYCFIKLGKSKVKNGKGIGLMSRCWGNIHRLHCHIRFKRI